MNQKPVDDKELVWQILDQTFTAGLNHKAPDWPSYKSMKPELIKQLNAYYQKKYLGLLPPEDNWGVKPAGEPYQLGYKKGWNAAISEALANIKSEGGE